MKIMSLLGIIERNFDDFFCDYSVDLYKMILMSIDIEENNSENWRSILSDHLIFIGSFTSLGNFWLFAYSSLHIPLLLLNENRPENV